MQLYHYIIYISANFHGILYSLTFIRFRRVQPSRLHRQTLFNRSLQRRHHLRLIRNLRRKIPSEQGLLNFLSCICPYTTHLKLRLIRFSWLCYQDSISLVRGTPFLRWNERPHPKLPNLPNVSCLIFVRFWCLAASSSSPLRLFVPESRTPLGGLRYPSNSTWSSCGRSGRTNSTHRYCQVFRYHFYRVCDLSTINVVPVWISLTPVLSLLLHQSTTPTDSKLLNHKHPSTFSQHAFRVRKPTGIETPLFPPPPKQPITSNDRKIWMLWSFATNCLGLQFVPIALFVRTRSLDECQVAVRSHKADFLSENER